MKATPSSSICQPSWSQALGDDVLGVALAREKNWLLAWDRAHWVYLLNRHGQRQAQHLFSGPIAKACCADDGSAYVVAGSEGEIRWLNPDLMPRWERKISCPLLTADVDSFGQYLVVSDHRGTLHLYNRLGQPLRQVPCPRPFHHLAFVPETPLLVGCADYGLVACCNWDGQFLWRDGLVANAGSLAVSGDGSHILIACFSDGIKVYNLSGQLTATWTAREACRFAAVAWDSSLTLAAGLGPRLFLLDRQGLTMATHQLDKPIAALALAALGDWAVVALANGSLLGLDITPSKD